MPTANWHRTRARGFAITIAVTAFVSLGAIQLSAQPASSETIHNSDLPPSAVAGADEAAFRNALVAWLNGDDPASLPVLADLARDQNLASQLLLGRMAGRSTLSQSPWARQLPDDEWNEIFRPARLGRFGTTWLRIAADDGSALAVALLPRPMSPEMIGNAADRARVAADAGERGNWPVVVADLFQLSEMEQLVRFDEIARPLGIEPYVWAAATHVEADTGGDIHLTGIHALVEGRMEGYAFLRLASPDHPAVADVSDDVRTFAYRALWGRGPGGLPLEPGPLATVAIWIDAEPLMEPLRRWCAQQCSDAVRDCRTGIYALLGGYHLFQNYFGSPLRSIIPDDVWGRSTRAQIDLETVAAQRIGAPNSFGSVQAQSLDACVVDRLHSVLADG